MNQIVIAVGGRGSRTKPVSDVIPKPLFEFSGKTFLRHLIESFALSGAKDFILLTGYLHEQFVIESRNIERELSVNIYVHFSEPEFETGARIKSAKKFLKPPFVFLYGDVFLPLTTFQLTQLIFGSNPLMGIYIGPYRSNKRNIKFNGDFFENYTKTKLDFSNAINCGYFLIDNQLLGKIGNGAVEDHILDNSFYSKQIRVLKSKNKYYTVGDPDRLSQTKRFFSGEKTLLIDRDGTLFKGLKPGEFHSDYKESYWKSGAIDFLSKIHFQGANIALVTNQPSVGNGLQTEEQMLYINRALVSRLRESGVNISGVFICAHGWNENCECRKPKAGLMYEAQHWLDLNWRHVCYVGDMSRDEALASEVDCNFVKVDAENDDWTHDNSKQIIEKLFTPK